MLIEQPRGDGRRWVQNKDKSACVGTVGLPASLTSTSTLFEQAGLAVAGMAFILGVLPCTAIHILPGGCEVVSKTRFAVRALHSFTHHLFGCSTLTKGRSASARGHLEPIYPVHLPNDAGPTVLGQRQSRCGSSRECRLTWSCPHFLPFPPCPRPSDRATRGVGCCFPPHGLR